MGYSIESKGSEGEGKGFSLVFPPSISRESS